jgi:IrrE N-terminal-like domain
VSPEELERRAEEVLARVPDWIWNGEEPPVPVEDIADSCFGLLVRDVEDMSTAPGSPSPAPGQSISGLLLAGPHEIWVNAAEAREWPGRRRFTIGHELGHWCLHREPGRQDLFCRKSAVDEDQPPEPTGAGAIEKEANIFAAALTMPAHLMREHYERLRHEPDCHARMCRLFNSSKAAMGRRLHTAID